MSDQNPNVIQPKNQPMPSVPQPLARLDAPPLYDLAPSRPRGGTAQIIIGAVMVVAGIGLSLSGIGYVFIGLIVFGAINLFRGLANASRS